MSRQRSALVGIVDRAAAGSLGWSCSLVFLGAAGVEARRPRRPAARAGNAQPSSPSRRPTSASGGTVQFVTDKRAYLNRGSRDGLAIKQSIQILRGGRSVASCVVDSVADHQATCAGGRPRVGDSFRLPTPGAALKHEAPPPELPPLTDEETLRARAAAVADARYDKVDFTGVRAFAAHTQAALSPSYVIWHSDPDPRGDYSLEQVDGLVHVYDLGRTGVDFHAAFTAQHWGSRASIGRFQPAAPSQFYLWQAELSRRRFDASTVFAVGRVWPWHAPGLTILDGFQIGRQSEDQTKEAGLYAGFLPTATTVAPSTAAWATGAYGTLVETGGTRSAFRLARQEGRIGVWGGAGAGTATDGEAFAQAWLGAWNVGGGGRAVYAPSIAPGIAIDRAYLDLGARPSLPFAMGAHVRYFGAALPAMAMLAGGHADRARERPRHWRCALGPRELDRCRWLRRLQPGSRHGPQLFLRGRRAEAAARCRRSRVRCRAGDGLAPRRSNLRSRPRSSRWPGSPAGAADGQRDRVHHPDARGERRRDRRVRGSRRRPHDLAAAARLVAGSSTDLDPGRSSLGPELRRDPGPQHDWKFLTHGTTHPSEEPRMRTEYRRTLVIAAFVTSLLADACSKESSAGAPAPVPPLPPAALAANAAAPPGPDLAAMPPPSPAAIQALLGARAEGAPGAGDGDSVSEVP